MKSPFTHRRCQHRIGSVALAAATVASLGCTSPPSNALTTADWCWLHYRLAPPGALAVDDGPDGAKEAAAWRRWLTSADHVPPARRDALRIQLDLVERVERSDRWHDGDRDRYRAAASSDPTATTICETVGARVVANADGTLPTGWEERFLDPRDAAYSPTAARDRSRP